MAFVRRHTEDYLAALEAGQWLTWKGLIDLAKTPDATVARAYFRWQSFGAGKGPSHEKAQRVSELLGAEFHRRGLYTPKQFAAYEGGPCFCGKPGHYRLEMTFYCRDHYSRAQALLKASLRTKQFERDGRLRERAKKLSDDRQLRHLGAVATATHGYHGK